MPDPEETDLGNADPFGRRTRPNGSGTFSEKEDDHDAGGRSHGFLSHVCAHCAAENWVDPGWLVFRCWSCGSTETLPL
jgi:hypothetical protein